MQETEYWIHTLPPHLVHTYAREGKMKLYIPVRGYEGLLYRARGIPFLYEPSLPYHQLNTYMHHTCGQ